jgi:hypothetical protein
MGLTPIQTVFDGYRFRSRLEARWAVFFNALGVKYEYEKEGFQLKNVWYLPDFWLPEVNAFVEVKGETPSKEEIAKCSALCLYSEKSVILVPGDNFAEPEYHEFYFHEWDVFHDDLRQRMREDPTEYSGDPDANGYVMHYVYNREQAKYEYMSLCRFCNGYSWDQVLSSHVKARSARFEHGETPSF